MVKTSESTQDREEEQAEVANTLEPKGVGVGGRDILSLLRCQQTPRSKVGT